jgi:nickel-dependent lactate racemase
MDYFCEGSPETIIDTARMEELLDSMLESLGPLHRVLLLPPDITRLHSGSGEIAAILYQRLAPKADVTIMPAAGTHLPMSPAELDLMFPGMPHDRFRFHDWRRDLKPLGEVPAELVRDLSGGRLDYTIPCEINRLLIDGGFDRILSIGQLLPHEVSGIANHNKNIFVGVGGARTINRSHYLGGVCGIESYMGRVDAPVRRDLPVSYILTVLGPDSAGHTVMRGVFAGDDEACFLRGAELCRRVNLYMQDRPLPRVLVRLDPAVYQSAWLGNKAIFRTRMAMADGGELIVLAPGVGRFGEDDQIDRIIRAVGYRGRDHTMRKVDELAEARQNLSACSHIMFSSSEGRFRITYAAGGLSREEIEGVGFDYADPAAVENQFKPDRLADGWNDLPGGEKVYYISEPGAGLWCLRSQFVD